jgi:hypothetical protein
MIVCLCVLYVQEVFQLRYLRELDIVGNHLVKYLRASLELRTLRIVFIRLCVCCRSRSCRSNCHCFVTCEVSECAGTRLSAFMMMYDLVTAVRVCQ